MLGRGPTGAMPTSWSRPSTTARCRALPTDGAKFFYDNPLESRGDASPLDLAPLPVLPAEHRPHRRIDRQLHVWCVGQGDRRPSLWRKHGAPECRRYSGDAHPADGISLERTRRDRRRLASAGLVSACRLRVPAWCRDAKLSIDGESVDVAVSRGQRLSAHRPPMARRRGRSCSICRWMSAPCTPTRRSRPISGVSHGARAADLLRRGSRQRGGPQRSSAGRRPGAGRYTGLVEQLGGPWRSSRGQARALGSDWDGKLYDAAEPVLEDTKARFVPYHLWDNRAPGEMLVWVRAER